MTLPTSNQTTAPTTARPKVPPIMFKYKKDNYKIIIKDLNKDFPNCDVKLAGKYLKIFTQSADEHRIVTAYLKEKSEEFYVIDPPDSRPLKIVIKGLPVSTEIGRETVLASSFYSQHGLPTISGLPLHDGQGHYRPEKSMTDSRKGSLAVGSNLFCSISM
ncbi:hypothetical protein TNCV_1487221 [Trichonephila clavipes]|nr:hypothetical protein TNCV_1487221 [Trichonephila clavipes]